MCHKLNKSRDRVEGTLYVTYLSWEVMNVNDEVDKFFAEKRKNIEKIEGKQIELIRCQSYLPIDNYTTQFSIVDHKVIVSNGSDHYIKIPLVLIVDFQLMDQYSIPSYIIHFVEYVNTHKGLCQFENGFPEWFKNYIAVALKEEKRDENKAKAMID